MRATIELDDAVGRQLEALAFRQRTTLARVIADAAVDLASRLPPASSPSRNAEQIVLPVVHGVRPISNEELKRAIEELEYADDLRRIGMSDDSTTGR